MNGKVNGNMDNPIDTSASNETEDSKNEKEADSEGCENASNICENSNHTEDSHHLDGESSPGDTTHSTAEDLENDISNGSDSQEQPTESTEDSELPDLESSNIIFLDSNCINRKESYLEKIPGRQVKSDANDENLRKIMIEKNQEAEEQARALGKDTSTITRITEITQEENSDLDSDVETSDEDIFDGELRAEDTVSINSDDQSQCLLKINDSDIIILENEEHGSPSQNGNAHDSQSPEIQEIISDNDNEDCVMPEENEKANNSDQKVQLRRSSRAIKRKRYNQDMDNGIRKSDLQAVTSGAFQRKHKPIVINDTKALVEMAARQMKSNQNHNQKKEPTVVIIDTNKLPSEKDKSAASNRTGLPISSSISSQSLYQSIVARGTTVTPVSSKSNAATQSSSQASQPSILPSLTDDMFVVEAPSFIVPYVYEKPSVKPFREFVDLLGKELDDLKAKEDKELQEKQNKEKENIEKEKQDKKEIAEDVQSEEEAKPPPSLASTDAVQAEPVDDKKKKKKEKMKRAAEEDDVSWNGSSTTDSEEETTLSDEENKTIIIKDKVDDLKDVAGLLADKVSSIKSDNYFDCSLGKFFINIGLSLVQEYVQSDLLKQQTRKLNREKKTGNSTKVTESSIASLKKNIEFSKENNAPYSFTQKKCEFCSFKTESNLAMAHHLETPHMKNNVYKCNFCEFEIRSPHDILYHMEAEHSIRGRLERAPAYHQCANCLFEDNGKGKLARHLIPCAKKFKPETNLAPTLEWEPPAKIPKLTRSRNSMVGSYQNTFNRNSISSSQGRQSASVPNIMPGASSSYRPRGRAHMSVPSRSLPVQGVPILRGGVMVRHNSPVHNSNYPIAKPKSHQPSISITPLPRQPPPVHLPPPTSNYRNTFVICEICDGYIKDLEQLRNHMQWIHKVKIHPKMIYNRPPLNCQKCQFRFFTDQGLERHLLGSHGLVTSSMQEAANKGKDAGRCPVCGRVYQWKLLHHVGRDHNLTLKPAHLSYKCTVCTATFGMYKQFENHVYSAHSVVAKRVMDKGKSAAPAKTSSDSLLKPLKINDEITIIPQPAKAASASAEDDD